MRIYDGNDYRDMTTEEIAAWEQDMSNTPDPESTLEERITALEVTTDDIILMMAELIGGE